MSSVVMKNKRCESHIHTFIWEWQSLAVKKRNFYI